jgi:hypothetical protein
VAGGLVLAKYWIKILYVCRLGLPPPPFRHQHRFNCHEQQQQQEEYMECKMQFRICMSIRLQQPEQQRNNKIIHKGDMTPVMMIMMTDSTVDLGNMIINDHHHD